MKVEYNGYTLEIEEVEDNEVDIKYYTANCAELPYFVSGIFKTDLAFIISYFKRTVHYYTFNELNKNKEEEKDFEYKGYTLKLGVVEIRKGGYCEELNYKTYGDDEEANITNFKRYINWKITSTPLGAGLPTKKEDTSHTHFLTQLGRLAKKDKEDNFTPFELRGQLVEIYHLFGKILSLTLEDIHKLYFERAEG